MPYQSNHDFAFDLCGITLASLYIYEKKIGLVTYIPYENETIEITKIKTISGGGIFNIFKLIFLLFFSY